MKIKNFQAFKLQGRFKMRMRKFLLVFFIIILGLNFACAYSTTNSTSADAFRCLNTSNQIMAQMAEDGFNVQRINDSIKSTTQIYDAQIILEARNLKADYSVIISSCQNIEQIEKSAYDAKDMLFSFNQEYEDFKNKVKNYNINTTAVDLTVAGINQEMKDERYEKIIEEVPKAEDLMARVETEATTMNLFYSTITGGIKKFFVNNYLTILIIAALFLAFFIVYRLRLKKYLIKRKLQKLEIERKVLKDMIKQTQSDYFQEGKISQGIYNIKTKKYAEIIRDIEPQA